MNVTYGQLTSLIAGMDGVVVALSGGVDSSLVVAAAHDALGTRALAVTGCSPTYSTDEREQAVVLARFLGVRHIFIETHEDDDPTYRSNPANRCYYCKRELFTELHEILQREGLSVILDGFNADDRTDFRPGHAAACELNVRSPLNELGLTKTDIRRLARERGLPNWDQPARACLALRIPYGEEITPARLQRVAAAEAAVRGLGFKTVRVRDHCTLARIELDAESIARAAEDGLRESITAACRAAGYTFVSLDMQGYRRGSMNEALGCLRADNEPSIAPQESLAGGGASRA